MKKFAFVVLCVALGFSVPAFSGGNDVDLKGLKDGETREFGEGKGKVTATREGDVINLKIAGRDGDDEVLELKVGDTGTMIMSIDGDKDASKVIIRSESKDGDHVEKDVRIIKKGWTDEDKNVFIMDGDDEHGAIFIHKDEDMDEHGAKVIELRVDSDKVTFRCPKGDTTMRLDKAEADGSFNCPLHSVALEKVEHGEGMRTMVIKKKIVKEEEIEEHR